MPNKMRKKNNANGFVNNLRNQKGMVLWNIYKGIVKNCNAIKLSKCKDFQSNVPLYINNNIWHKCFVMQNKLAKFKNFCSLLFIDGRLNINHSVSFSIAKYSNRDLDILDSSSSITITIWIRSACNILTLYKQWVLHTLLFILTTHCKHDKR